MSYTTENFAVRTVRPGGLVKISGRTYGVREGTVTVDEFVNRMIEKTDPALTAALKAHGGVQQPVMQPGAVYDGRLDGLRLAFGRYTIHDEQGRRYFQPFVSLWGTERRFMFKTEEEIESDVDWPGPDCVGTISLWPWWEAKDDGLCYRCGERRRRPHPMTGRCVDAFCLLCYLKAIGREDEWERLKDRA